MENKQIFIRRAIFSSDLTKDIILITKEGARQMPSLSLQKQKAEDKTQATVFLTQNMNICVCVHAHTQSFKLALHNENRRYKKVNILNIKDLSILSSHQENWQQDYSLSQKIRKAFSGASDHHKRRSLKDTDTEITK